ncbi:MAG TPA: FAD-containing oxidoreductase [Polyangiaceae bacterium]|jgi:pyruvate/2-oxoglutarate dehydrogenase complex dihydrolipoamide dehydrogenase (E3) component
MSELFDAIVIGAGQSGPSIAVRMAKQGLRTALIERGELGGTCVNTGCIPSKTLVASARVAHLVARAAEFGITLPGPACADWPTIKARKDAVVAQSRTSLRRWLSETERLSLIQGHARFEGPRTLRIADRLLEAEKIVINVGARAARPDVPGLARTPHLDNESVMDVGALPEHLLILGGGYVGLEFAQIFRRFGCQVTVVQRAPRLIPREDEDASALAKTLLESEGVVVRVSSSALGVEQRGSGVVLNISEAQNPREVSGSHLLLATGRRPNTDDLGLEHTQVECDERGYIQVNDALETSESGVWATGEVNGRGAFTHTSYNDYEVLAANLFDNDPRKVTDRISAQALYLDPPLGRVGMTERQVRDSGRRALVGRLPMSRVGRARERDETLGYIKVLVDAESHQLLGAAIFGIEGDEAVHTLLAAMYARAPYTTLQRAMFIHPTVNELLPTVLGELSPL